MIVKVRRMVPNVRVGNVVMPGDWDGIHLGKRSDAFIWPGSDWICGYGDPPEQKRGQANGNR